MPQVYVCKSCNSSTLYVHNAHAPIVIAFSTASLDNRPIIVIDCGRSDIPRPGNGSVMANQTTLGSIATFTCDASFILVGDEMRTCESTGWSGNNPTCGKYILVTYDI